MLGGDELFDALMMVSNVLQISFGETWLITSIEIFKNQQALEFKKYAETLSIFFSRPAFQLKL